MRPPRPHTHNVACLKEAVDTVVASAAKGKATPQKLLAALNCDESIVHYLGDMIAHSHRELSQQLAEDEVAPQLGFTLVIIANAFALLDEVDELTREFDVSNN